MKTYLVKFHTVTILGKRKDFEWKTTGNTENEVRELTNTNGKVFLPDPFVIDSIKVVK